MSQADEISLFNLQIMKLVPDFWQLMNSFWKTKLDGCSFQAPHASPGPRLMETNFLLLLSILCVSFIKFTCLINLCSSGSSHIMATKTPTKNYLFLYHYLLDECCSAFINVLCHFSVFTHYDNYNKNHLLHPSIGSRWWFGCCSVLPLSAMTNSKFLFVVQKASYIL